MSARPFAGLQFVLVGRFSVYQYVVEDLIKQYGGEVVSFATKETHVAIVGKDPSPAKIGWVRKMKIQQWSEDMLEGRIREAMRQQIKSEDQAIENLFNEEYGTW